MITMLLAWWKKDALENNDATKVTLLGDSDKKSNNPLSKWWLYANQALVVDVS